VTNNWKETLRWYDFHQTAREIGFNPDGQCLKVCRTARDIGPMFPTAKAAQDATPKEHRVYKVEDLRRGMDLFFDDPNDSNKAGHIVTMIGRVKGFKDWKSLDDVLVETNSVVAGQLVVVRASYFKKHWGDSFQFGTTWLNGHELDYPTKRKPKPQEPSRVENFIASRPDYDVKILDRTGRADVQKTIVGIQRAVDALPHDEGNTRINRFRKRFREERVLEMSLLDNAVEDGRTGEVKKARDRINMAIKQLPRR
jgi:hypothetical protein